MNFLTKTALLFSLPTMLMAAGTTVENDDGTFTYTETITNAPGFGEYRWYNEDFGWRHTFPDYNIDGISISSATLAISAYDVDSEAFHGTEGEYDTISIDGIDLNPGLLQGENGKDSITNFDIPLNDITDDGNMNVFVDIDTFHTSRHWATSISKSQIVINYSIVDNNNPPNQPEIEPVETAKGIEIQVVGPTPGDPDQDDVSYRYRWFVDVGQGLFSDDEVVGKPNHTGSSVPSSSLKVGELWRVEVTPVDSKGAIGQSAVYTWPVITDDADGDGVPDDQDAYPEDASRAFNNYYPSQNAYNTLFFEDLWPNKGDYDLNDLVVQFNYAFATDAKNQVKDITMKVDLVAAGGADHNGFAIAIEGIKDTDVKTATITVDGNTAEDIHPESGHTNHATFVFTNDVRALMPGTGAFQFYNVEAGDGRPAIALELKIEMNEAQNIRLSEAPFKPFIFKTYERAKEIHLVDHAPTEKHLKPFATADDDSDPATGRYYRTAANLPWVVEANGRVEHVLEGTDIGKAYPKILSWAVSNGTLDQNWADSPAKQYLWSAP